MQTVYEFKFQVDAVSESRSTTESGRTDTGRPIRIPAVLRTATLVPVAGRGGTAGENAVFAAATPAGSITLEIIDPALAEPFQVYRECRVIFMFDDPLPVEVTP